MSRNVFNSSGTAYLGPQAIAFNRAAMLAGAPATFITLGITGGPNEESFLPAHLDGLTSPPAGTPNTFVEWPGGNNANNYKLFHFHVDFAAPANSTFTQFGPLVAAAPFTQICPGDARMRASVGHNDQPRCHRKPVNVPASLSEFWHS